MIFSAETKETLYTAVLSDVLDSLGHTAQAVLPFMRPLDDSLVFVGRARTRSVRTAVRPLSRVAG